jgi:transcription elongation factor Elf1
MKRFEVIFQCMACFFKKTKVVFRAEEAGGELCPNCDTDLECVSIMVLRPAPMYQKSLDKAG